MKTVFDAVVREELIRRIRNLNEKSAARWGKMNVFQMIRHCTVWDEWTQGKSNPDYKQGFFGKIFGKQALWKNTQDNRPIGKGMPAGKGFVVKERDGDTEQQKTIWVKLIEGYADYSNPQFVHDFFGKMTREQIGIFAYKHADHHLRQFGC